MKNRYWDMVEKKRKTRLGHLRKIYKKVYNDEEKDRRLTDYAPSSDS